MKTHKISFLSTVLVLTAGCNDRTNSRTGVASKIQQVPVATGPISFEREILPILGRSCLECHDAIERSGEIDLDQEATAIDRETWSRVADVLRSGSMPPKGRSKLTASESEKIEQWIDAEVFVCAQADREPGRVTLRRLSRIEYDHTIRDLFGLDHDLNLGALFPADDVGDGFDRIGDVLAIPPILLEKYLIAADRAIDAACANPVMWARVMNPPVDSVPIGLRKPRFVVRNEPVKRIGRPLPSPAVVENPEASLLRRAHEILRSFADRAFRRPSTEDELTRLLGLFESARREGDDFDQAIRHAFKAVLISPQFLFLIEDGPSNQGEGKPGPIDEFALACRLSYFLTSSPPDDELERLAVLGQLRGGENLEKQARRLLRTEKSQALVDGFIVQWLQIGSLKDVTPDPGRFPDFDEPLRQAMTEETCRLAAAMIREDRSVIDFLDADYTYLNERLARHYGIGGVTGPEFRRVGLSGTARGGILTHASILTVTSNATRTSPVKRGRWILENLLGLPPSPPPEGVEGFKSVDNIDGPRTVRERLERHRRDPACSSCHDRMDPLGFALDNFDAIGAWRKFEEGQIIDTSATLPGGELISGPAQLREELKKRSESFVRRLAEKMLIYALGRGLRPTDRCFVDAIARKTRDDGNRFSSLVLAIVQSPPFQTRSVSKD